MKSEQALKRILELTGSLDNERVKMLAGDLASIPNVQIWIEDNSELRIGVIPQIFKGIGSDLITYSDGWIKFRKTNVIEYLSETVRMTIFYLPAQVKEVERVLHKIPASWLVTAR